MRWLVVTAAKGVLLVVLWVACVEGMFAYAATHPAAVVILWGVAVVPTVALFESVRKEL